MAGGFTRAMAPHARILEIDADTDTLIDQLAGATGIATFPAAAAAADGVSVAEVLRYVSELQLVTPVARATAALPASTAGALFTITGGNVELIALVGEVTTVIQTLANATKLTFNPNATGASTDLCTSLDITADAVGTLYSITGTAGDQLQNGLLIVPALAQPLILAPGTIDLDCAATSSGQVQWFLVYRRIESGASVAAA